MGTGVRYAHQSFADISTGMSALFEDVGIKLALRNIEAGMAWRRAGIAPGAPGLFEAGVGGKLASLTLGCELIMLQDDGVPARSAQNSLKCGIANPLNRTMDLRLAFFLPWVAGVPSRHGPAVRPGFSLHDGIWSLDVAASIDLGNGAGPGLSTELGLGWSFGNERSQVR